MSFFGKLFGTEKALIGIVDGVTKGLDALVYTEEEKATSAADNRTEARKMVVNWMVATQGQNLARRLLALSIGGFWLSMYAVSWLCSFAAVFVNDNGVVTAVKLNDAAAIAKASAVDMSSPVMIILAFYFAAPHMSSMVETFFNKSANKS